MKAESKRMTFSDLQKSTVNTSGSSNKTLPRVAPLQDGEQVHRIFKKSVNAEGTVQDDAAIKRRTNVYRDGELISSEG